MTSAVQTSINDEDWFLIRDFVDDGEKFTLPKYEAKYVADVGKGTLDDDLVLVRETSSFGNERIHHVPRDVIESIAIHLPE